MNHLLVILSDIPLPLKLDCDFSHPLACALRRTLVPRATRTELSAHVQALLSLAHSEALCVQRLSLLTKFFTLEYLLVPICHEYKLQ